MCVGDEVTRLFVRYLWDIVLKCIGECSIKELAALACLGLTVSEYDSVLILRQGFLCIFAKTASICFEALAVCSPYWRRTI